MRNHSRIIIYSAFILLSIIIMLPVVTNMSSVMYGLQGDPDYRIWQSWYFKYAFLNNKPLYSCDFIGAPFGVNLTLMPYHLFWDKLQFFTTLITNEVFSYNLFIFLSFFLSGITMYHLSYHITKDRAAGAFSAILFMLCPYHLARSVGHLTLANIQWLPLFLLCSLKLLEDHKLKRAVFLGLSLAITFISSYYYGIFSFVILSIFLFLTIAIYKIKLTGKLISYLVIALLISMVIISVFIFPVYKNINAISSDASQLNEAYVNPVKYLFSGSARPLSYLLPSYMHPVFGGFTKLFVGSPLYGESKGENALYLGILPLILSWVAIRRKTKISKIFFYLFLASVVLSMPPYIKFLRFIIPLPQYLIFKALPIFRTFARFGVYAMLCVSVLAGLGLKELMARTKDSYIRGRCMYALFVAIVLFEFLVNPFRYATDLSKPPEVYKWLANQKGDFVICEYPLNEGFAMRNDWLIWQRFHKKRKIDGAFPGSGAEKVRGHILRLQDNKTPPMLRWLGVKYVIVHVEDMKKSETLDIVGEMPDFSKQPGLRLIKKFEDTELYEVTGKALKPDL